MGAINWKSNNKHVQLRARCLFGRHAGCDVRVDQPKISGEHASLRWVNGAWELRDLGSRNGTFLAGRRLESGERVFLEAGMTFSLSRSAAIFEFRDATAPQAAALHTQSGTWHVAARGILALPSERRPLVTVFSTTEDHWLIEIGDQVRSAVDQEVIPIGGDTFMLEVPEPAIETLQSGASVALLESIRLRIGVTPDEEQVEVTILIPGRPPKRLPPRRYHYLLATLARAWLADDGVPPSVRGWVERDELCKKLDMDVSKLNVEIHRARKQLAALGIQGAAGLVERRPGTWEIRIGVPDVEVTKL
jgi:hypothetical protein